METGKVLYVAESGRSIGIRWDGYLEVFRTRNVGGEGIFCNEDITERLSEDSSLKNVLRLGPVLRAMNKFTEFNSDLTKNTKDVLTVISKNMGDFLEKPVDLYSGYEWESQSVRGEIELLLRVVLKKQNRVLCEIEVHKRFIRVYIGNIILVKGWTSMIYMLDLQGLLDALGTEDAAVCALEVIQVMLYRSGIWMTRKECGFIKSNKTSNIFTGPEVKSCSSYEELRAAISGLVVNLSRFAKSEAWVSPMCQAWEIRATLVGAAEEEFLTSTELEELVQRFQQSEDFEGELQSEVNNECDIPWGEDLPMPRFTEREVGDGNV